MLSKVYSATTVGLDGVPIEVEVDIAGHGFPTVTIVGLPSKAVDESKERVRAALTNTSFEMPDSRVVINLAPADLPKDGARFDLPIAVGILASSNMIKKELLEGSFFLGELSLEGNVRGVFGVIAAALLAKKIGIRRLFVPMENADEAALATGISVLPVSHLSDVVLHCNGEKEIMPHRKNLLHLPEKRVFEFDFRDIRGQNQAKRALEIVAAGFHNIHLSGPPGAGKTMLSRALASIMPPMSSSEMLETIKIHSIAGTLGRTFGPVQRPYRSPHHTISRIGLIGGGTKPLPGEVSLAHNGILFLDELPEFPRTVLEALRQPVEDGRIIISRASGTLTFPCRFILIAASNPCPCGYAGHKRKVCRCMPGSILRYRKKLSGPLLDRIDLHTTVSSVEHTELLAVSDSESSAHILERIMGARHRQEERFKMTNISFNSQMKPRDIKRYCHLEDGALEFLKKVLSRFTLSARSYYKLLKVSQTICDLDGYETITQGAIAEALQFRLREE